MLYDYDPMRLERVLIAVPCYNEECRVEGVVNDLLEIVGTLPFKCDIRVFDDASTDRSRELLEQIQPVSVVVSEHNLGYAANLARIYDYAYKQEYDALFVFDGDGQHDPKNLILLLDRISKGYESVSASRYVVGNDFKLTFPKRIGVFLYRVVLLILGCGWVSDPTSGNFALSKPMIMLLAKLSSRYYVMEASLVYVMKRSGLRFCSVPGKFYQYEDLVSMYDYSLVWSLKSFMKVVQTVIQLSRIQVSHIILETQECHGGTRGIA